MRLIIKILAVLLLMSSFITHTIDINSSNLILARMTISDIFGLAMILIYGIDVGFVQKKQIKTPKVYVAALFTIICMFTSIITSLNSRSTLFETLILCYLLLLSYILYEVFKNDFKGFTTILIFLLFTLSSIGLYDVIAININFPTIFSSAERSHGISGFRYFGQAANFTFTLLSILIPYKYYIDDKDMSSVSRLFFNSTLVLGVCFLFTTGRISIIISFIFGCFLFLIWSRKKSIFNDFCKVFVLFISFVFFLYYFAPGLFSNILFRIQSRITNRQDDSPQASFIVENFKCSITAFFDNPLFGTGLGGYLNNYDMFEIHGTYLKILGETGLIGMTAYLLFLYYFLKNITFKSVSYFYYFLPFLVASFVSWSYNYHFRKKEFWILLAFMMCVSHGFKFQQRKTS